MVREEFMVLNQEDLEDLAAALPVLAELLQQQELLEEHLVQYHLLLVGETLDKQYHQVVAEVVAEVVLDHLEVEQMEEMDFSIQTLQDH